MLLFGLEEDIAYNAFFSSKREGYWLASAPPESDDIVEYLFAIDGSKYGDLASVHTDETYLHIRPVVCLKSDVKVTRTYWDDEREEAWEIYDE